MRNFVAKQFNLVVTGTAMAMFCLIHTFVAPVPGLIPVLLTLLALGCIFSVRLVLQKWQAGDARVAEPAQADNLHSALDFAHDGIAVLDAGQRVIYTNREFRRLFRLDLETVKDCPAFIDIVRHGLACGVYETNGEDANSFCARRVASVASSAPQPMMLHMAYHTTIRFSCSVLPDGGRMLTYSNITELADDVERLEVLAHIDSMTGLINRRRFFDIAGREWSLAQRYGREISVLMLDIDHFKKVNDSFGHAAGDDVIRHVAAICIDSKRASDVVARLGGEEFALLLPETDAAGAMHLAERIRSRVAANPLVLEGQLLPVTVSIGIAERRVDLASFEAMLARSDAMLYAAKSAGRNCVLRHRPDPVPDARLPKAGAA